MSRLIDADAITRSTELTKKIVLYDLTPYIKVDDLIQFIDNLPTAYDIENVVAELEEMIKPKQFYFCKYAKGGCKYIDDDKKDCMECVVEHAIAIVRKGGVE